MTDDCELCGKPLSEHRICTCCGKPACHVVHTLKGKMTLCNICEGRRVSLYEELTGDVPHVFDPELFHRSKGMRNVPVDTGRGWEDR